MNMNIDTSVSRFALKHLQNRPYDSPSDSSTPPVLVSRPSSNSPNPSLRPGQSRSEVPSAAFQSLQPNSRQSDDSIQGFESDFEDWENDSDMPSDLRPPLHRPTDGKSQTPLLGGRSNSGYDSPTRPALTKRRSTFREGNSELSAKNATRQRYIYATFFLLLSLVSFVIQTETAVYIQHNLHWNKAYCMLYVYIPRERASCLPSDIA